MNGLDKKEIGVLAAVLLLAFIISLFFYPKGAIHSSSGSSSYMLDVNDYEVMDMAYLSGDKSACNFLDDQDLLAECVNKARHGELLQEAAYKNSFNTISSQDKKMLVQAMSANDPVICQSIIDYTTRTRCEEATS